MGTRELGDVGWRGGGCRGKKGNGLNRVREEGDLEKKRGIFCLVYQRKARKALWVNVCSAFYIAIEHGFRYSYPFLRSCFGMDDLCQSQVYQTFRPLDDS